jgi:hypothetical protein
MTTAPSRRTLSLTSTTRAGPTLRRYRLRTLTIWAVASLAGLSPILLGVSGRWRAFGLGVWFPGAGFLYSGWWWATQVTLIVFGVSLGLWVLMGAFIAPIAVWTGAAVLAALAAGNTGWEPAQWAVPLVSVTVLLLGWLSSIIRRRKARGAEADLCEYLSGLPFVEPQSTGPTVAELSEHDLRAMRYLFDLMLQPIERFDGFGTIDQFREAAWRYQLFSTNYALAALQANHLPAFHGVLRQAQRNAIIKTTDWRVWRYWRVENFVGNLKIGRSAADPVASENIMFSGYWALALGAYERATGDLQFSRPGALTLTDKRGREYVYDYPAIVECVTRQFDDPLCLFPCEPNWVFLVCNLYGMGGCLLFDREHSTRHALDRLDRFNDKMETEFARSDGRFVVIASRRTGITLPSAEPMTLQSYTWLANMASPRLAQAMWAAVRRHHLKQTGGDLQRIDPRVQVDPGNYRMSDAFFWGTMMASAREMGDNELYDIATARFDADSSVKERGALAHPASMFAYATAQVGRFGSEGTWYRSAHGDVPAATRSGPILDDAPYPQVLVASATNDGRALRLVVYPGDGHPEQARFSFAGLDPRREYRITGMTESRTVIADDHGRLDAPIPVRGRTELTVAPNP